jgi:hypothetical protein
MTTRIKQVAAVTLAIAAGLASIARAGPVPVSTTTITSFTPGDLVVMRGGDGTNSQNIDSNGEVSAYLDEYTRAGAYVGTVALPDSGANQFTLPGSAITSHEGQLNLSPNGQFLTFAGYETDDNATNAGGNLVPSGSGDNSSDRIIGEVGASVSSLSTNTIVNAYPGSIIRGAETVNGTDFWSYGKYVITQSGDNFGGLQYVAGTGGSATTTPLLPGDDWRQIQIVNGQMYGGTGSSSVGNHALYQIGTGEPASGTPAVTQLIPPPPGANSVTDFVFTNSASGTASPNGFNTMYYVGDQSGTDTFAKYFYNGASWSEAALLTSTHLGSGGVDIGIPESIAVAPDASITNAMDIYVSTPSGVYEATDTSGTASGTIANDSFTDLFGPNDSGSTDLTDENFYGLAFAPTAVPEPATVSLMAAGAAGLLARRRRRHA